jgi:oxalate decarboxylase/phosphoglucose isomerase-like protein (cupin superfamily)
VHVRRYSEIEPFQTLDGSQIREWAGKVAMPACNQSLAEATIPVGGATTEHYHRTTEELYLVSAGRGRLLVDRRLTLPSYAPTFMLDPETIAPTLAFSR